jgi:PST family polysaccharide transporter
MYPVFAIPFRLIELPVRQLIVTLWPALSASLVMLVAIVVLRLVPIGAKVTQPWIVLGVIVPVGMLVYAWSLLRCRPPVLRDIVQFLLLDRMPWLGRIMKRIGLTQ